MKRNYYPALALVICAVLLTQVGDRSFAVNYDREIQKAEEKKKNSAEREKELRKEIEDMEKNKEDILAYIKKLDKKIEKLQQEIDLAAQAIEKTKKEITKYKKELKVAEESANLQYDTMKKRIKYMYENGSQDYLDILFSSKNIADLLNRAEYVEKISDYDKKMFSEYQKTKTEIEEKSKELNSRLELLEGYEYEEKIEREALKTIQKNKKNELKNFNQRLTDSQKTAKEFAKQAARAEAEVERLLQEKQKEIERQNQVDAGEFVGDGTLSWPLPSPGRISSGFGKRVSPTAGASTYHKGLDIAIAAGTPVLASGSGKVVTATYSSSAGNYVMISHGNRLYTVYMHCSSLSVREGAQVEKGSTIGYVGSTGISTGAHLHFGVSKDGAYVNPLSYVTQP